MKYKVGQLVKVQDLFTEEVYNLKIVRAIPGLYGGVTIDSDSFESEYEFEEIEIVGLLRCKKLDLI